MKLIRQITDLNKAIKDNHELGFVPTMGGLHKGHESLINLSKKKCKKTLVSIFVNPKQFNSVYDYNTYPRNLNKDLNILKKLKVDIVFLPNINQIFRSKKSTKFRLKKSQKILCAKYRKGHFEGVLDVLNRLIYRISPKYVFMGEKDFQQFFLVKEYLEKVHESKIILCKTIRSIYKVALSSRNLFLSKKELYIASFVAKKLIRLKKKMNQNQIKNNYLIKNVKSDFIKKFNIKIEYLEVRNTDNLNTKIIPNKFKIFIAYYLNNIRLIDNF